MKQLGLQGLVLAAGLTGAAVVHAQPAASPEAGAQDTTSTVVEDGARFRFGVSLGTGFFTVKAETGPGEASLKYYGTDLRFGLQVNDLIGVYAQPTLGYYTADNEGVLAVGGLLGVAPVVDFTFADRFFVGAGLGYTIYNSPSGVSPLLRIGGYPLMGRSEEKARRKGLMVGIDLRLTKLEGLKTIVMPSLNIGYEAF